MGIALIAPDGVAITAQQERVGRAAMHGGGAGRRVGGRSGFRVDTPSDLLAVSTTAWSVKPCAAMIDPGAATNQGMYGWSTDVNVTGTPTPPDATNPRKDIYYIQVSDYTAGDGTSGTPSAPVLYLAGTPSATPVAPTLPPRSLLIGTATVPQVGGGSPTVVINPARYVAAGGIQPATLAERDALTAYDTLTVRRTDLAGRPIETYTPAGWRSPIEAASVVTDGNWSATGQVTRALSPDGQSMATIGERMLRTGASFTLTTSYLTILPGFIPAGFRPPSMFNGWALLTNAVDLPVAAMWWRINPSGDLEARLDGGSVLLDTGHRFNISGNWSVA